MVTDASANVISRHDFLPFGEELPPNSAGRNGQWGPGDDNIAQRFTGQIRDEETDLDYFNARYFGAALGRFTSPDPQNAGANPMNPQSWNGYGYVLGNPLANTDPSGMTNYAGIQQGFCPASKANCPMPGNPVVGIPTVPNEMDEGDARYVQLIVIPGFQNPAPSLILSYDSGYSAGASTNDDSTAEQIKQTSAESVTTSNFGDPGPITPNVPLRPASGQPPPGQQMAPQQKQTGTYTAYAACLFGAMPKVLFTSAFGVGLTAAAGRSYSNPVPPPSGGAPRRSFEPGLKWGVKGQIIGSIVFIATYEVELNAAAKSCSSSTGYTPLVLQP